MGKLIDRSKRERAQERRVLRKKRIIEVAQSIFARMPYVEVTLDAIGQSADVDRGVASMYFGSKEELFLLLLKKELEGWYEVLEGHFEEETESLAAVYFFIGTHFRVFRANRALLRVFRIQEKGTLPTSS